MAQNPGTTFHEENLVPKYGWGVRGCENASAKRGTFLRFYSSDPDAESSELGGVLASSSSSESSLCLLFFLLLFSPEELSSLDANSLLLKLSLSCLEADLDDESLEGVDFFSIFTFTFFFFDLSLLEDSPQPPSYSFVASSYSLLASSALRSHSPFFSLDIPLQISPAFLERSVILMPGWPDLIFSQLALSHSM
uniref:uncharacterized protein LOC118149868 n=1 Tax=Callithrix jacchus TaxID=9483 RepID=UPI00159DBF11|nr:uncharacterized protein LOC118149868 [Callithrix jacchus]